MFPLTGVLHLANRVPFAGGSFGTVYKAIDKTDGEIVAIKHVRPFNPTQWCPIDLSPLPDRSRI